MGAGERRAVVTFREAAQAARAIEAGQATPVKTPPVDENRAVSDK